MQICLQSTKRPDQQWLSRVTTPFLSLASVNDLSSRSAQRETFSLNCDASKSAMWREFKPVGLATAVSSCDVRAAGARGMLTCVEPSWPLARPPLATISRVGPAARCMRGEFRHQIVHSQGGPCLPGQDPNSIVHPGLATHEQLSLRIDFRAPRRVEV